VSKTSDSGGEDFGGNDEGCCVGIEVVEKLENFISLRVNEKEIV